MTQHLPYFHQLGTQLGHGDARIDHLADLLRHPDAMPPRTFVPADIPAAMRPAAALSVPDGTIGP